MFALQSFCHKVVVELFEVKPKKKKNPKKEKQKLSKSHFKIYENKYELWVQLIFV